MKFLARVQRVMSSGTAAELVLLLAQDVNCRYNRSAELHVETGEVFLAKGYLCSSSTFWCGAHTVLCDRRDALSLTFIFPWVTLLAPYSPNCFSEVCS